MFLGVWFRKSTTYDVHFKAEKCWEGNFAGTSKRWNLVFHNYRILPGKNVGEKKLFDWFSHLLIWICLRWFFSLTLYHGKSPLNHPWGEYVWNFFHPHLRSKSKRKVVTFQDPSNLEALVPWNQVELWSGWWPHLPYYVYHYIYVCLYLQNILYIHIRFKSYIYTFY